MPDQEYEPADQDLEAEVLSEIGMSVEGELPPADEPVPGDELVDGIDEDEVEREVAEGTSNDHRAHAVFDQQSDLSGRDSEATKEKPENLWP
jgi:hypothetical protein